DACKIIPAAYWSVRPAPPGPDGEAQLLLRGAVLVRVHGRRPSVHTHPPEAPAMEASPSTPLAPELVAALNAPPSRPGRVLFQLLRAEGLRTLSVVLVALVLAAGGGPAEAVLLRSLFALSRERGLAGQRLGALGALLGFLTVLLLLEGPLVAGVLRLGRHLEARLRVAFFQKLPRLGD